ncbi:MAG: TrmH family RNA methyltransferase [Acidimicrobiales bacterium]
MNRLGARDPKVQRLRRLLRRASVRESERAFVAEGVRVVEAALDAGAPLESLFVAADWRSSTSVTAVVERAEAAGLPVFELGPGIMERVADTVSPQAVCGVVKALDLGLDELLSRSVPGGAQGVVLVCVDVRDPGNLGAVLRIASATGAFGVVCCEGTVDPFNPKVVRASAGAVFRVPLVTGVLPAQALAGLSAGGYRAWATVPRGGTDYEAADLDGPTAFVFGNEGAGLPGEVLGALDGSITIPMADGTESLNVAMTAAVLCFDAARRRRSAG